MADVKVTRTKVKVPTVDDPEREVYQIMYRSGELPPRFVFIPVKDYTEELEKEKIKADLEKRQASKEETLTL